MSTDATCAAWGPVPSRAMNGTARRLGSGSRISNADRGNVSGGSWYDQIASVTSPRPSTTFRATPT